MEERDVIKEWEEGTEERGDVKESYEGAGDGTKGTYERNGTEE
jgi:hypothetical protein